MKPTELIIKNIGKIAEQTIAINKPLILFYGEIKQGKTTILNCVRWVCGGEFPADIIRHGATEGSIELKFDGGMIGRSFYRAKPVGEKPPETKSRPVVFIRNGKPVPAPVGEIKRLLNPFLLDQDFLRNKTELQRKQYFSEMFAVDTTTLDSELFNVQRDASNLRAKISGYGDIDLTPVEMVSVEGLEAELKVIKKANKTLDDAHETECEKYNARLNLRAEKAALRDEIKEEMDELEKQLVKLRLEHAATCTCLDMNPLLPEPGEPVLKSTDEVETKLRNAGAVNVRAEQYQANKKRAEQKAADEKKLSELVKLGSEIKAKKQAKLKNISDTCGIKGLSFDEEGNFIYDGTTAGMISDSQIMRLSSELSALYPPDFGLELLDRGESLGRSIFDFVDTAKAQKKTILATIVGERPAKIPAEIGVFVVADGKAVEA